MEIEKKVREKFEELISSGNELKCGREHGYVHNEEHSQRCVEWLASAQNIVHLVIGNNDNPYKKLVDMRNRGTVLCFTKITINDDLPKG